MAMTGEQIMSALGGVAFLVIGVRAIVTRVVTITGEDGSEPHLWVYGWRAVAIGCLFVAVATVFFACASGYISWAQLRI